MSQGCWRQTQAGRRRLPIRWRRPECLVGAARARRRPSPLFQGLRGCGREGPGRETRHLVWWVHVAMALETRGAI